MSLPARSWKERSEPLRFGGVISRTIGMFGSFPGLKIVLQVGPLKFGCCFFIPGEIWYLGWKISIKVLSFQLLFRREMEAPFCGQDRIITLLSITFIRWQVDGFHFAKLLRKQVGDRSAGHTNPYRNTACNIWLWTLELFWPATSFQWKYLILTKKFIFPSPQWSSLGLSYNASFKSIICLPLFFFLRMYIELPTNSWSAELI